MSGGASPVLVVDDDPYIRDSLRDLLESEGYTVAEAPDGEAALNLLRRGVQPALILLDLAMPVMDGRTFLAHKQADRDLARIPTVVVSAVPEPIHSAEVLGVVSKPIDVDRLLGYLHQAPRSETPVNEPQGNTLTRTDAIWQSFVESVQDYAIFLLDPAGRVATWNRGAERIKQYKAAEIIGRHLSTFYPPQDVANRKPWRALEIATQTGKFTDEGWRVRKDGTQFWASVTITAVYDAAHKVVGFGKVTRDLTDKRNTELALRASEERYRSLVAGVKEYAIFMLDEQGNVSSWNAGAERMKGYTEAEILGRNFSLFYTPEDLEAHKPQHELEIAKTEGIYEEEGWRVRKNGERFLARVLISPLRDEHGRLFGFTKITRDITDEREAARIAESLRMRDLFLSVVAHELRTPITSVKLQADTMRRFMSRSPDPAVLVERLTKYLRISEAQIERLGKLVNDLLELSRVNSRKMRIDVSQVDLSELVKACWEGFELAAEQSGNQVSFELPPGIEGRWDKTRLEQVISNLITNAIRHAPGSRIAIKARRDGASAELRIDDEGPGIPGEDLEQVTQPFVQSTGPGVAAGGLGIGLFITQGIVAAHGGTLGLANRTPHGLSVTVRLPLQPSQTPS